MTGSFKQFFGGAIIMMVMISCNLSSTTIDQPIPTIANTPTPANTATSPLPPTFPPPVEMPTTTPVPTDTPTETSTSTPVPPTETLTSTLLPYDPNSTPTPPPTIPSGYSSSSITPLPYYSPTVTSLPPTARPSSSVTAIAFTPAIDGDWSEWPNAETTSGYVVFGNANWVGANDLNSSFKVAYDANFLYIAVKVKDDIYVQKATGYQIYLGDSLEILLDTDLVGDYAVKTLNDDDFQLGISPGKETIDEPKEAYLWYPQNIRGQRDQVVVDSDSLEAGYLVEAAIPWSLFGITPVSGQHYGFALSVSDNDNPTKSVQESMVSSASTRKFLNPTTWGDLTLQ